MGTFRRCIRARIASTSGLARKGSAPRGAQIAFFSAGVTIEQRVGPVSCQA